MKKISVLFVLSALLLAACSEASSENVNEGVFGIISSKDAPKFYADEKEVEDFRKNNDLKKQITIGSNEFNDLTMWSMASKRTGEVDDFEFYFDRMNEELSIDETFEFLHKVVPKDFYEHYEEPKKTKAIDSDGENRYYWQYNYKDFYGDEPEGMPGQFVFEVRMNGDLADFARIHHGMDRQLKNYDELEWDLD